MAKAGYILSSIESALQAMVKPGISTLEIDQRAFDLAKKENVEVAFLGYQDYPANCCFGVNDTVVHGIPSENEILEEGDIISIDFGIKYKGFYSDRAITVGVGKIHQNARKLIETTRESLYNAIDEAVEGNTIGDIGNAIESTVKQKGFSVVKPLVGHGIGKNLHEMPNVPGYGIPGKGIELRNGMTIAIEAIINEGSDEIFFLDDGWTTKTEDGKLSAIFEHTVLVGKNKAKILTK